MKLFTQAFLVIALAALGLLAVNGRRPEGQTTADVVFKNGNVYTVNSSRPKAQAFAVKADRIVFVGSNFEAQRYVGPSTRVIDLQGKTVVPGMTDAHQHLPGVGFREMTLNLEGFPASRISWQSESASGSGKPGEGYPAAAGLKPSEKLPASRLAADPTKLPQTILSFLRARWTRSVVNSAALKIAP